MVVLEVRVNGQLISTAGRGDLCVLNAIIDAVGELGPESGGTKTEKDGFRVGLHVGGLAARTDEDPGTHLRWIPHRALEVGDEISVRIVMSTTADEPQAETAGAPVGEVQQQHWEAARDFYLKHKHKYERHDG